MIKCRAIKSHLFHVQLFLVSTSYKYQQCSASRDYNGHFWNDKVSTIMMSWQHTISFIDHSLNHHGKNTSVQIKVKLKKKMKRKDRSNYLHSPMSVTFILLDLHDLVLYFKQTNNTKRSNQYLKSQYGFDSQRRLTTALN